MSDLRGFDIKLGKNRLGYLANSEHADPATSHTHTHRYIYRYIYDGRIALVIRTQWACGADLR